MRVDLDPDEGTVLPWERITVWNNPATGRQFARLIVPIPPWLAGPLITVGLWWRRKIRRSPEGL